MIAKPEYLKIISCPEKCRKKFKTFADLNIHLAKKHKLDYKIKHDSKGHAQKLRTS